MNDQMRDLVRVVGQHQARRDSKFCFGLKSPDRRCEGEVNVLGALVEPCWGARVIRKFGRQETVPLEFFELLFPLPEPDFTVVCKDDRIECNKPIIVDIDEVIARPM